MIHGMHDISMQIILILYFVLHGIATIYRELSPDIALYSTVSCTSLLIVAE